MMAVHLKANVTPGPQRLELSSPELFRELPQSVQDAVVQFNHCGPALLTAVESRINHLPLEEQVEISSKLFQALGMPLISLSPLPEPAPVDLTKNTLPRTTVRLSLDT